MKTHYEVLGLPPSATAKQLHERFKELALEHHPDKVVVTSDMSVRTARKATELQIAACNTFAMVTAAYAVLKNEAARASYDALLRLTRRVCGVCDGEGTVSVTKGFTARTTKPCKKCGGVGYL